VSASQGLQSSIGRHIKEQIIEKEKQLPDQKKKKTRKS